MSKSKMSPSYMHFFQLQNMAGHPGHTTLPVMRTATRAESDTVTTQGTLSHVMDRLMFMVSRPRLSHAQSLIVQVILK